MHEHKKTDFIPQHILYATAKHRNTKRLQSIGMKMETRKTGEILPEENDTKADEFTSKQCSPPPTE